jgi:hypothetical protein
MENKTQSNKTTKADQDKDSLVIKSNETKQKDDELKPDDERKAVKTPKFKIFKSKVRQETRKIEDEFTRPIRDFTD